MRILAILVLAMVCVEAVSQYLYHNGSRVAPLSTDTIVWSD